MEKADVYAYNVDSLYNVAPLTQKQKVISAALSRAEKRPINHLSIKIVTPL